MKAKRAEVKSELVPVIITLESQEEVDSLYEIGNHCTSGNVLPALNRWYVQLAPFSDEENNNVLWSKLNKAIRS